MTEHTLRLLFVCIENSNRSQMAEGFARTHGGRRVAAFSSGSRPSGVVNPRAIQCMREKGIDLSGHHSKGFEELPIVTWDYVVTMGCGDACPAMSSRQRRDWDLPDPRNMPEDEFRAVRDRIEQLVVELIAEATASNQTIR